MKFINMGLLEKRCTDGTGRASGFGPQGREFEFASIPEVFTLLVASPYQGVNVGSDPGLGNQS